MVSTHLKKYARQHGNLPQFSGWKLKNIWVATTQIWIQTLQLGLGYGAWSTCRLWCAQPKQNRRETCWGTRLPTNITQCLKNRRNYWIGKKMRFPKTLFKKNSGWGELLNFPKHIPSPESFADLQSWMIEVIFSNGERMTDDRPSLQPRTAS